MRIDKRISVTQLSKMFGKSKTDMFRVIDRLKFEGKIRRVGSEKSGTWEVKMNDLKNNMDLSRIPNPTEKDLARIERYTVEYENLLNVLRNSL